MNKKINSSTNSATPSKNNYAHVILFNPKTLIADRCVVGDSFMKRLVGLMGKKNLKMEDALWLPRCSSIHMWFMKTKIDVLFLKKIKTNGNQHHFQVVSLHSSVKPWKLFPLWSVWAHDVLEICEGSIEKNKIKKGDSLCIEYSF